MLFIGKDRVQIELLNMFIIVLIRQTVFYCRNFLENSQLI